MKIQYKEILVSTPENLERDGSVIFVVGSHIDEESQGHESVHTFITGTIRNGKLKPNRFDDAQSRTHPRGFDL